MKHIHIAFNESFYIKAFRKHAAIIALSILFAAFFVAIYYPGIMYSDSYVRIDASTGIRNAVKMLLSGQRELIDMEIWLTVVPSFFITFCHSLTGSIATYTMLQASAFFLVSFLLIHKLSHYCRKLQYLLFAINPLFFGVATYYEAGIGCLIGIVMLYLLYSTADSSKIWIDQIIEFGLVTLASFITFGYRANAITILPVLFLYIWLQKRRLAQRLRAYLGLFSGLFFVLFMPKILNINTMSSSVAGLVWEMVTCIEHMDEDTRTAYLTYLDDIGGEGATVSALAINEEHSICKLLESSAFNIHSLSQEGMVGQVIGKYISFALSEPESFIHNKWRFASKTLGVSEPLRCIEYEYNLNDRMYEWGVNDSTQRLTFYRLYYKINESFGFLTLQPWLVFIATGLFITIDIIRHGMKHRLHLFLVLTAICYYGAFLLNTQSFELRYFYPSLYLMLLTDAALFFNTVQEIVLHFSQVKEVQPG